jgi:hypothetical protein
MEHDWRRTFSLAGFEIVKERALSRWRNLAHPVARRFFVLRTNSDIRYLPQTASTAVAAGCVLELTNQ